jgi:hypothetical protein
MTDHDMAQAWADLLEALTLLAQHPTAGSDPFVCTHDELYVTADAAKFTDAELDRLAHLGFDVNRDGGFRSYRFGSA